MFHRQAGSSHLYIAPAWRSLGILAVAHSTHQSHVTGLTLAGTSRFWPRLRRSTAASYPRQIAPLGLTLIRAPRQSCCALPAKAGEFTLQARHAPNWSFKPNPRSPISRQSHCSISANLRPTAGVGLTTVLARTREGYG